MKFLKLENALKNVIADGKNMDNIAGAFEHILNDKETDGGEKSEKLADLIRSWDSSDSED